MMTDGLLKGPSPGEARRGWGAVFDAAQALATTGARARVLAIRRSHPNSEFTCA